MRGSGVVVRRAEWVSTNLQHREGEFWDHRRLFMFTILLSRGGGRGADVNVCILGSGFDIDHVGCGGRGVWGTNIVDDGYSIDEEGYGHGTVLIVLALSPLRQWQRSIMM